MEQKKLYVEPNVDVYEMKVQQMLCDSMPEPSRVGFIEPEDED